MRRASLALVLLVTASVASAGCKPGGAYALDQTSRGEADRGETNGRMFDLISNKPDGDDWQIRIRDSSMWVAYADGTEDVQLGTVNLDARETGKVWELIDEIDVGGRDQGEPDEDAGYLQLRLREPGGEEGHEVISVYVTRDTDDDSIVELGKYLQKLVQKYHKKQADL